MQPGKCLHYNGTVNECCRVGVNYEMLAGGKTRGWGLRLPCLKEYAGSEAELCWLRREPTDEELAEDSQRQKYRWSCIAAAREAIVKHLGGPWKKGMPHRSGVIDCPVCGHKETLRFRRAGYNGHIHCQCQTPGCVSWLE